MFVVFKRISISFAMFVAILCCLSSKVWSQSEFLTADNFVEDVILDNLPIATTFAFAPEGMIFIALKEGVVRVVKDGTLLPTPFADISAITNRNTDRGLLGLALDPNFPAQPYVYMLHVYDPPGRVQDSPDPRVIRLIRMIADPSKEYAVALPDSTEVILGKNSLSEWIAPLFDKNSKVYPEPASCMTGLSMDGQPIEDCLPADARSHSAGALLFGPDRSLYVSLGDGSNYETANRPALRAQMLDSLAGKILRIHPDTGQGIAGNPFFDPEKPNMNRAKIWSYGLRNPFRIARNPLNGQIFSGDVGSSSWEEVNAGKGANFGWPCYEGGVSPNASSSESGDTASLRNSSYGNFSRTRDVCRPLFALGEGAVQSPIFSYAHQYIDGKDAGGSTTGLAFYTGRAYPAKYRKGLFIADYALRWLRLLTFDDIGKASVHDFAREVGSGLGVVDLKAGPDTNIYALYLDLKTRSSQLRRFRFAGDANIPPRVAVTASPDSGSVPLEVTFRSDGTFDPDGQELSYSWDFGDGVTSEEMHPTHTYRKVGTYTARLTVKESTAPFAAASRAVTIRTGLTPPKAYIDSPVKDFSYAIGDTITFSGRASFNGSEDNPEAQLSWAILQHHNDHIHLEQEVTGPGGSFVAEDHADNTWYELCLLVSVGDGLEDQTCREIFPRRSTVSFLSEPVGARVTYVEEQIDVLSPHIAYPIIGSKRSIIAQQIHADRSFVGWSDGLLEPQRSFVVGGAAGEFTAQYKNLPPEANIDAATTTTSVGQVIRFDGTKSYDPERTLLSFSWNFGDGSTGTGETVEHSYNKPGVYTLVLTVEDKLGSTDSREMVIVVADDSTPTVTPTNSVAASPTTTPTHSPTVMATSSPTTTPTDSRTVTPQASPTPRPTDSPTVAPTASPTSTSLDTPTPEPQPSPQPSSTITPGATNPPLQPILNLVSRANRKCLSRSRACSISSGESLRVRGDSVEKSDFDYNGWQVSLRVRRIQSRSSVLISASKLKKVGGSWRILPGSLFSRPGLYSVRLRLRDPANQRILASKLRFVFVRK